MEDIFEVFDELFDDEVDNVDIINVVEPGRAPRVFNERVLINDFTDEDFIERFRLSKESVRWVLNEIIHLVERPTDQ
jgi:hypothetical protein